MKKRGFILSKRSGKSLLPRKHAPIDLVEKSLLQLQKNLQDQQEDQGKVDFSY